MKNSEWYLIKDLREFIDHARKLVFKFFGEMNQSSPDSFTSMLSLTGPEKTEMDNTLTFNECEIIVKNFIKTKVNRRTKLLEHYINDKILTKILEAFNSRMISNILNKLVNDGLLETAFDEKTNDFIFWVKENDIKKQNPETD
ncbi:hypothetical protein EB118_10350 [bacterium]|nr:hypothetical protein [bacterium]NDC95121.1 hypothetical protein [bacterium]NDD85394.1 hypothetical protein [bacterium]NDG30457.1 hypothetical protein [bacterium]